jgi:hypothetical protein
MTSVGACAYRCEGSRVGASGQRTCYTVGRDIVFGAGRYAPDTISGRQLLSHELTHGQQSHGLTGGAQLPSSLQISMAAIATNETRESS